jgi:hypothetical protein
MLRSAAVALDAIKLNTAQNASNPEYFINSPFHLNFDAQ